MKMSENTWYTIVYPCRTKIIELLYFVQKIKKDKVQLTYLSSNYLNFQTENFSLDAIENNDTHYLLKNYFILEELND